MCFNLFNFPIFLNLRDSLAIADESFDSQDIKFVFLFFCNLPDQTFDQIIKFERKTLAE